MERIVILGAGHLSWHLAQVLQKAGYSTVVATRQCGLSWPVPLVGYHELEDLGADAGAVVIAGRDAEINALSRRIPQTMRDSLPVLHCSGAAPLGVLDESIRHPGVLWPVRSFRRGEAAESWQALPLVYDGESERALAYVRALATTLSTATYWLDDRQRARLHLAAIFGNNFSNWLYQIAHELCAERQVPFEALLPLLRETANKQTTAPPRLIQTGPAARGDTPTLDRHLADLADHPDYQALYRTFSALIARGMATTTDDPRKA